MNSTVKEIILGPLVMNGIRNSTIAIRTFGWFIGALLLVFATPDSVRAQAPDLYMGSEVRPIRIALGATYQQFSDEDRRLSQLSFPFSAFIPFTSQIALTLRTNPALASGESVTPLEGMSDAQAALSYHQPIGEGSVVVSFTSNLPSGKRELTEEEFATSALLSQDFYGFYVPALGQGLNLSPGLTVAYPINDDFAIGLGFAYQLKGEFKPVVGMEESFTPGDEMLFTGGFDVRLSPFWALSTTFTYTLYEADQLGAVEVYESGNQSQASLQVIGNLGNNQLRLFTRYRTKAKSVLPVGDDIVTAPRTVPEQVQFMGSYTVRLQENVHAVLLGRARYFKATDFFGNKTLVDLGASPQYAFNDNVAAVLRFVYTFGSFPGVEIGGGMAFTVN